MANKTYSLKFTLSDGGTLDAGEFIVPQGEKGDKGDKGDAGITPNITSSATVDNTVGTPTVTVTKGGTAANPVFTFAFSGIKGNQGVQGDTGSQGPQGPQGPKGDPFTISKVYSSVDAMNAGYATDGVPIGGFVIIDTGNVADEDNAKLYVKGDTSYTYLTDLSGAQGMKGEKGDKGDSADIPYSASTPFMDGVGSVGSANTVARGDHRHPSDTSRQEKLVSGTNIKTINGRSVLGSGDVKTYPIGSIYISASSATPGSLFGGTWERIKDVFLLSAGDTYHAGLTGGSADAVAVRHGGHVRPSDFGASSIATADWEVAPSSNSYYLNLDKVNAYGDRRTFTKESGNEVGFRTLYKGESGTGKNMPPYLTVYMWRRLT